MCDKGNYNDKLICHWIIFLDEREKKNIWSTEQFTNTNWSAQIDSFPLALPTFVVKKNPTVYYQTEKWIEHCALKKTLEKSCIVNGKLSSTVDF